MPNSPSGEPALQSVRRRILLIQAVDYDESMLSGFEPQLAPVSVATIAALTPASFDVDIWDENLDGPINPSTTLPSIHYDIVGISTLFERVGRRVPKIAALFRERGAYICVGGPGVSNQVRQLNSCVDSLFLNEAEHTWPQFLDDWTSGCPKHEYVQVAKPDLSQSPPPSWGRLGEQIFRYRSGSVQTTRGCPFDCEFCDVIYLYGRAQRHKPIDNVLTEVRNLQVLGARRIMFTDDEFVGDPRYAKALLEALIPLNNSFDAPLAFHTQFTMTLSHREELLELMADANFWYGVVGIESFHTPSLLETHKIQNINGDIVHNLRNILSYGIGINGSLIIGFDSDGAGTFERILDGVQRSCLPTASVSILRATYGTKLWTRMRESDRLWKLPDQEHLAEALQVDILPKGGLSRAELIEGRIFLNDAFANVKNLCARLRGWVDLVRRIPRINDRRQLTLDGGIQLIRSYESLGFALDELREIDETLEYANAKMPVMIGRVTDSILNQLRWHRLRNFHSGGQLKAVLAAERTGHLVPDRTPVLLPTAFAHAFRQHLFGVVYGRLHRNLPAIDLVADAASEVFVDFLVRVTGEADFSHPRHDEFLRLLCDRTAARLTGASPDSYAAVEGDESYNSGRIKKSGLPDAVLKEIGDRLRRLNERAA